MRKALVTIGAILVAMLGALFIVPAFIDWNRFRGELEEEVSRVIGREVRVGGGVSLRLLPFPYVSFEKVRINDNSGALGEPFFRADAFTMWLSVAPLLRGTIEASEVELRRPVVTLAIDAAGAGNWADFKASQGSLPFVPADVTLQALNIIDGVVQVQGPNQAEIIQVENLFGELSAEAIDGPYKFRGTAKWRGLPREIRFATAKAEADGSVRLKANVRAEDTGSSYLVDARVVDLKSRPRIDGEVTANLAPPAAASQSDARAMRAADAQAGMLELKAKLAAESTKAALSDILITFDQGGQPQLVTGAADIAWIGGLRARVQLGSRWLDLDKLAGAKAGEQPSDTVRTLVGALTGLLPDAGEVEIGFSVDQVNLGGEAVSGLRLGIARASGPLQVNELKASLPGGTRLELNGVIASGEKGMGFLGDVGLRGASYSRFINWGAKGAGVADQRNDGPFSLAGRLSLAQGGIEVTEAIAELLGTPLTGQLSYRWEGRRQLAIALEGQQIDMSALIPGGLDLATARGLFWPDNGAKQAQPTQAATPRGLDTKSLDLKLRLRAAEVTIGDRLLRDVDADVAVANGKLSVPSLRLTTVEGLGLELEGDVTEVGAQKPKGMLRWVVDAADTTAITALANLIGASSEDLPATPVLEGLLPARMAGALRFGGRTEMAQDVSFDGLVRGNRVMGTFKLDGGFNGWRQAPVDLTASGEAADAVRLASLLWSGAGAKSAPLQPQSPAAKGGKFAFRAIGLPTSGLLSVAGLEGPDASLHYEGKIALPKEGARDLDGIVRFAAPDAEQVLAVSGLGLRGGKTGVPVQGTADLVAKDGVVRIAARQVKVGETALAGAITLSPVAGSATTQFDAELGADSATVAGLISVLLDRRQPTGATPDTAIWPDTPFDLAALDGLTGKVRLRAGTLTLAPGVTLGDTVLEASMGGGKLQLSKLEGRGLGGNFSARANLERATAGAVISGALRLDGANLSALAAPGAASGSLALNLQFDGRALSPRAMITVLTGKGELEVGQSRFARSAPGAVQTVADQLIENRGEIAGEPLKQAVRQALAPTQLAVGPRKIGLQIADGVIKAQRATIDGGDGRAIIDTVIDIASLKADSEWKLEPKTAAKPTAQRGTGQTGGLPSVSLIYVGTLGQLAAIEPRINVEALERELAVRRMERDVEELEKVRRFDEERARQELERLRALGEERAKSAAPPPAATSPSAVAPAGEQPAPVPPQSSSSAALPPPPAGATAAPAPTGAASPAAPAGAPPAGDAGSAATSAPPPRPGARAPGGKPAPTKGAPFRPFSDTGQVGQ